MTQVMGERESPLDAPTSYVSEEQLRERWLQLHAPALGDLRQELAAEAAEFFGLSRDEVLQQMSSGAQSFSKEWAEKRVDAQDREALVRFYNESRAEVFDLLEWHATDTIHYRSLVCVGLARRFGGAQYLDYGSGIGTDAITFGLMGFDVTLADVSEPLLRFAEWRCRRRGLAVRVLDLKREQLPADAFDAVSCFDVLEHIPDPRPAMRRIRDSLRQHGLLFLHAPFGVDPERPMHVAHRDVVSPRLRSWGFHNRVDLERAFPPTMWAPRVYERLAPRALDRFGYYLQDAVLPAGLGDALGRAYRRVVRSGSVGPRQ